jgi:thymidylate kinase
MKRKQRIFMLEGPDGCGKTQIAKELSRRYKIPYFRMDTQHQNWKVPGAFVNALRFDQTYSAAFLKQTGYSVVLDRGFPSEFCYSKVFKRKTDEVVLCDVDEAFAKLGTVVIIPMRSSYASVKDEVVPLEKMQEIHTTYHDFCNWTACKTIRIYTDDFLNDLDLEIPEIKKGLRDVEEFGFDFSIRYKCGFNRGTK